MRERGVGRRRLLTGGAAALLAGTVSCGQAHRASSPTVSEAPHQPGIITRPPDAAVFAAFDVRVADQRALMQLLRRISDHTTTATAETLLSVGASLFDGRYGIAARRPPGLTAMPSFPNDDLDPARCHGDLLLQVCAPDDATAQRGVDGVVAAAGPGLLPRWRIAGFRAQNTIAGNGRATTRNLLGFQEGISNPDVHDDAAMRRLVWASDGGTFQVVRLIRFATELWDGEPLSTQEATFGRRRSDGAPLGHDTETEAFTYQDDPTGRFIALDAHIRRANPRTPQTAGSRILRRGYSYRDGTEQGLVFVCFQHDLATGFETVQKRLTGEALDKYVLPFGGGYFYAPPAAANGSFLAASLFDA